MAKNTSNKSTSSVSLARQYRELKRELMGKAKKEDLVNMLSVVTAWRTGNLKEMPKSIKEMITILSVASISERLAKIERESPNAKPTRRTDPNPDRVDDLVSG